VGFGKKEAAVMRSAKHLLACAVVICCVFVAGNKASLAATCMLTAADFESLKLSKFALGDQTAVDVLPQDRRDLLCKTRRTWNHIAAGTWTQEDFRHVSAAALSPAETKIFNKLQLEVVKAILSKMSDSDFQKMHRDWMEQLKK
jgi:hypothetical protein